MNRKSVVVVGLVVGIGWILLTGARGFAEETAVSGGGVPSLISFQGFLADSNGDPVADGSYPMVFGVYDAANGGTKIWEETQNSVTASNGFFAVLLGSGSCTTGCPLSADTFSNATRYLETSVDIGGGMVAFPRQQLAAAPYTLQAEHALQADQADQATQADQANLAQTAEVANAAPWSGLTGVPAGFADGTDDGNQYEHVITVATDGGDYTSVAAALAAITDASPTNRYLVRVMPGVYTETNLVEVKAYVHVHGSGPNTTVITSARSNATPGNAAATVDLLENGRISHLTVRNEGTGTFGIALYSAETSRATVVDNVVAEAIGAGGTGHYAAYWNDAEATIRHSTLFAGGATGFGTAVNAAFGTVNSAGGFPQALIENSILMGGAASNLENCNDSTGTGFGMQLSNASPLVRYSYICGGHRGIGVYTNGNMQLQNSSVKVSSTGSAFLFEISASGSISVANSGISYTGNKFTGAGTGLRCVHSYNLGTWAALSNGTTAATACN